MKLVPMENLHILGYVGLLILLSQVAGRLAISLGSPRLIGYLATGIVLGPSLLGLFHETLVKEELGLITDIALVIIAFSIGGAISAQKLKQFGRAIFWITTSEAFGAFLIVTAILSLFLPFIHTSGPADQTFWTIYFPMSLVIGAVSVATAPAATLALIQEYRAKGPFTTILLAVVALDDGLTILLFAFAANVAQGFATQTPITWKNILLAPSLSIVTAAMIGLAGGIGLRVLTPFFHHRATMFGMMVGFIFLISGLAMTLEVSPLLSGMTLGFVVTNFAGRLRGIFPVLDTVEEAIFGMFFALAGAHMDFKVLQTGGWLAALIVLGRFSGKLLGTHVGALISRAPDTVRKYLGLALLPKAGVTVGLILAGRHIFPAAEISELMVSAVLGSTIINELMTPYFVRYALRKSGEATV